MSNDAPLSFRVALDINKAVETVFNAVVDPAILSSYFTSHADKALAAGTTVVWQWGKERSETHVVELVGNTRIVCTWRAYQVDYDTRCTFLFERRGQNACTLRIEESGWRNDESGRRSSYEHCSGWTHMLMCMKARLEHDIDLRSPY